MGSVTKTAKVCISLNGQLINRPTVCGNYMKLNLPFRAKKGVNRLKLG